MKYSLLLITAFLPFCLFSQVVNTDLIDSYDLDEIEQIMQDLSIPDGFINAVYPVDFYRVEYMTPHPNGEMVQVSGALCIPQSMDCPLPLSSYQHGTIARKIDAPSFQSTEGLLCALYASAGYLSVAPDYIGLGTGEGLHLYVHAESEANACIDLMRAARDLQDELDYVLNEELFIWGYSQGGHATAALQRKIELEASEEFTITASAPMSGPYDISGVQANVITADEVYPTPGYLPYVVFSYQEVYGTLYEEPSDLFVEPYATILPPLFNGENSMGFINNQCPDIPNEMLRPEVLEAFETDPDHPIRVALEDNDVMDWAPQVPTTLYYCDADDQVNYMNALMAAELFAGQGSDQVELVNMGSWDHGLCAPFAMFEGYNWFESLRTDPFESSVEATVTPDAGSSTGAIELEVSADGNWSFEWSNGSEELDLEGLEAGIYDLSIISEEGCRDHYQYEVGIATTIAQKENTIEIYPNPASEIIQIKTSEPLQLTLFDASGKRIRDFQIMGNTQLDLSAVEPGLYFLSSGGASVQKLIIQ